MLQQGVRKVTGGAQSLGTSWRIGEGTAEDFQKKVIFKETPYP